MAEKLSESTVTLETSDGSMDAFQVLPDVETRAPAVIIAQEAFGVNTHIKDVCQRFASEGYVALAPDMYHRTGRMLSFAYDDPKRREPFAALTDEGIESDINAALAHLIYLPLALGTPRVARTRRYRSPFTMQGTQMNIRTRYYERSRGLW
ncbi:MAG: dienelactone hydrolase family protein [Burkholderiales bacterium]